MNEIVRLILGIHTTQHVRVNYYGRHYERDRSLRGMREFLTRIGYPKGHRFQFGWSIFEC